jgi:hypothetical protein
MFDKGLSKRPDGLPALFNSENPPLEVGFLIFSDYTVF